MTGSNSQPLKILAISGSLRRASYNTALLRVAQEVAPEGTEITLFNIGDLPLYNADLEAGGFPDTVTALHEAVREADGIVFASPEYNHSFSGPIKNAIDWASRSQQERSLPDKPVTMIGAGGGAGTARAQSHLENVFNETRSLVMIKPGVLVANPWDKFDSDGRLQDEMTRTVLADHLEKFKQWILWVGTTREAVVSYSEFETNVRLC